MWLLTFSVFHAAFPQAVEVASPNGKLVFSFNIQPAPDGSSGAMYYNIRYGGQTVVEPSRLGLIMKDRNGDEHRDWMHGITITDTHTASKDTVWQPVYGERNIIPDRYHSLTIDLTFAEKEEEDADPLVLQLIVRAYDEGIAFQYHWPEKMNTQNLWIAAEKTRFNFPAKTKGWFTHRAQSEYELLPLQDWERPTEMPLTVELSNGLYACVPKPTW